MKTKTFLISLIFLLQVNLLFAQTAPDTTYRKELRYNKPFAYPTQIIEANGGGLIVLVNAHDTKTTDTAVIYLHQVNENGQNEWTAQIADQDSALWPYSIIPTHEADGYIIIGTTISMESPSTYDYFILRTNNSGGVVWKKNYGVADYDEIAMHVIQTDDGNYLILGGTQMAEPEPMWHLKFFTRKIDGSGSQLWYKTYGNNKNYSTPTKMVKTSNGYMLAGYSLYNDTYAFLIKLDNNGDSLFTKTFRIDDYKHSYIHDIALASNGDFFLVGNVSNAYPSPHDVVLVRVNENGELRWRKIINFSESLGDYGMSIHKGSNTTLYLAGTCNDNDHFIMKTDTSGNEVWQKVMNDYPYSTGNDMIKIGDYLYLCGTAEFDTEKVPFVEKYLSPDNAQGFSYLPDNEPVISVTNLQNNIIKVSINPDLKGNVNLEIFDISGRKVHGTINTKNSQDFYLSGIKTGIYIIRCIVGHHSENKKIIVY